MLRWLKPKPVVVVPPRIPQGRRVYAIGDVHGMADLLVALIDQISADDAARGPATTHIVFLGDLVDRGPDTARVLDLLIEARFGTATLHFVAGNHEEMMLASIDNRNGERDAWLSFGGAEALESYGIAAAAIAAGGFALEHAMRTAIPAAHLEFMAGFDDSVRIGDYLFVHAGILPGVPLDAQQPRDLRWIRNKFLDSQVDHGVMVVHGHTVVDEPTFARNRIGIDTGAYQSGKLTALGLEGDAQWILST
nr:metallophosphoesterase family protein [Sphingomonas hylomeconis]